MNLKFARPNANVFKRNLLSGSKVCLGVKVKLLRDKAYRLLLGGESSRECDLTRFSPFSLVFNEF